VIISPVGDNMCDLYNSFIDLKIQLTVLWKNNIPTNTATTTTNERAELIGYKYSMDTIEQYQLIANGITFYTQNNAIEESYITGLCTTESVKKADMDSKVRHIDVWNRIDTIRAGVLVNIPNDGFNATQAILLLPISLKIDLRRFLSLSKIRLLPKFVGGVQLRIKISPAGLVCAPLPIDDVLSEPTKLYKLASPYPLITNKFMPLTEEFTMLNVVSFASETGKACDTAKNALRISKFLVLQCYSCLHCFGIDNNVYNGLVQRYTNQTLSFPTQTLSFQSTN
jgi:hypothetical protein